MRSFSSSLGAHSYSSSRFSPDKRVLILRIRLAAADLQILHRLQEQRRARNVRQLGTQAGDHLVGADLARVQRLQDDEHAALVLRAVAAHEGQHVFHRRILLHDADELVGLRLHRLERDILVAHDHAGQASRVLLREEAFGNDDVEADIHDRP